MPYPPEIIPRLDTDGSVLESSKHKLDLMRESIAENTRRNYASALAMWSAYLRETGQPDNDASFSAFLSYLDSEANGGKGYAKSTIQLIRSGIQFAYRLQGRDLCGVQSQRVLRGIQRKGKAGRGQQRGVEIEIVEKLRTQRMLADSLKSVRDALIFSLLSDGLLRGSELLTIKVRDLSIQPDGSGRLLVPRSKTDQTGKGAVLYIRFETVKVLKRYIHLSGLSDDDVLIQGLQHRGCTLSGRPMSMPGLNKMIKTVFREVFDESEKISSHSFRIGTAETLAELGVSLVELQNAGRWSSPSMPSRYTRNQDAGRSAMAKLDHGKI